MIERYCPILVLAVCLASCDKGIAPTGTGEVKPGFGGTITYVSSPPPRDSLVQLRVIAVPYYPIDSVVAVLIQKISDGTIPFSDTLQVANIDSGKTQQYSFFLSPAEYKYVAVVQQYGDLIFEDWRVVGIYGFTPSSPYPASVTVTAGKFQTGVDFVVDFKHLPPQPFKR